MNERFEELKRRAVAEADTSHIDFDNMSHTEIQMLGNISVERKFAELIVKETLEVARAGMEFGPSMEDAVYTYFGIDQ